jgi:hypothetical protein
MKYIQKRNIPIFLLVLLLILLKVLSYFPDFVTAFYSEKLYLNWGIFLRFLLGKIPFSIGDVGYFVLIFFALRWIWFLKRNWKSNRTNYLFKAVNFFSYIFLLFHISWGFNYLRTPLANTLAIKKQYSQTDLENFTCELIQKTNLLHLEIAKNDTITYQNPYPIASIFLKSEITYQKLVKTNPLLRYKNLSVKKSLMSLPLSYMGFSGYFNPFTNEAQVNYNIPKYNLPTTTLHEMAHQIGFASESEANFIGYLASITSDDVHFQYSGLTFALKYCLKNIERLETGRAEIFLAQINQGIINNFLETEAYHAAYASYLEIFSKNVYDFFLKFNRQKDGLEGYNNFVGLMLNYHVEHRLVRF